ncbi:hypothetical protein [Paenibacillus sp. MMS18-CY102]|uniref:hypothetical protein n=1 Tax=Paenibacillus sp. MMS18-CY102 TaxID=2682849 RepID=UPI0013658C1F|nr:hypothetical protein [Paenibacillus sp. MMS18-CY102]MWC27755.1 hypothetical protein [Paenibacillus sp. MMS18-CY102]
MWTVVMVAGSYLVGKFCIKTFGSSETSVVMEIGVVKKVASRTIHVDWGKKTWVYQNKDFKFTALTKEEVEQKYRKRKFTDVTLQRAIELGIEPQG